MKYAKPKLGRLNTEIAAATCKNGSGAAGSGCTAGPEAGAACSPGNGPGGGISCWDGTSAGWCGYGNAPTNGVASRCEAGSGVVNP